MSDNTNIDQKAGFGAQGNTFIGEQHNHSGLTPADATQMAFAIFREYYPLLRQEALDALSKMLEEKLGKISPNEIVPPKPRIIVPALQDASLTEEQEIRELYAELLANSMNRKMKDKVHPGYVEIVKQLCPDEAKILRFMLTHYRIPVVTLQYQKQGGGSINAVTNFSDVGELTQCEHPLKVDEYFDNLIRLGLLRSSPVFSALKDKELYKALEAHEMLKNWLAAETLKYVGCEKTNFEEGYMELTEYGKAFCEICVSEDSQSK